MLINVPPYEAIGYGVLPLVNDALFSVFSRYSASCLHSTSRPLSTAPVLRILTVGRYQGRRAEWSPPNLFPKK